MNKITVAIDGPSGAGKSTIAKILAAKYKLNYLDTGALFRCLAYFAKTENLDIAADGPDELLKKCQIKLKPGPEGLHYFVNNTKVDDLIRNEEIANAASLLSRNTGLRQYVLLLERDFAAASAVVMDGRDIGTVVLPNAEIKIYLDARPEERAVRRLAELQAKGINTDYKTVLEQINQRDQQDMNRKIAPLRKAADAVYIDSSQMDINEVAERISNIIEQFRG